MSNNNKTCTTFRSNLFSYRMAGKWADHRALYFRCYVNFSPRCSVWLLLNDTGWNIHIYIYGVGSDAIESKAIYARHGSRKKERGKCICSFRVLMFHHFCVPLMEFRAFLLLFHAMANVFLGELKMRNCRTSITCTYFVVENRACSRCIAHVLTAGLVAYHPLPKQIYNTRIAIFLSSAVFHALIDSLYYTLIQKCLLGRRASSISDVPRFHPFFCWHCATLRSKEIINRCIIRDWSCYVGGQDEHDAPPHRTPTSRIWRRKKNVRVKKE